MTISTGMIVLIIGVLVAILGLLLLLGHGTTGKIIAGILLLVIGLSGAKVGYDLDQSTETEYTVTEITAVTARDNNNNYRITIKDVNGVETWIYVNDDNLFRFPKDKTVTMTKAEVKKYSQQS